MDGHSRKRTHHRSWDGRGHLLRGRWSGHFRRKHGCSQRPGREAGKQGAAASRRDGTGSRLGTRTSVRLCSADGGIGLERVSERAHVEWMDGWMDGWMDVLHSPGYA
ncbi:uncharacterized protein UV8b_02668 [Ustilaginoidea virens]|uniref:Uncharacterized protein n=1 Tax=Ustilaginoidea virens TaxID=1159556 RepID=A0A8E5MGC1_USTVR|nr:uncharacterized protein UV8b_02668 [Ustilaginoidea virens]QUC18427.1 hypothetical protein UV8b_02668 [Ustilaginoidea virens]